MKNPERTLALVLRMFGGLDLLAFVAVAMPEAWLALAHRMAGLGTLPDAPIVGYLSRTASAMYVLHGATVVFISFDVVHYRRLIRFLAFAALFHGAVMLAIDVWQNMPLYWRLAEGPLFAATGVVVLWCQRAQGDRSI
jgi:hypothetical protein